MRSKHHTEQREEFLSSPTEIFTTLVKELQRAHKSIDMEFYIFEGDRIGTTTANILCRKSRQGVRVRLLVDGYGSRNLPRTLQHKMISAGVELRFARTFWHSRNHRKMVIIDNHTALIGSINIADRYISGNRLGLWHDAVLHLKDRTINALHTLFEHDFSAKTKQMYITPHAPYNPILYWSECGGGGGMVRLLKDIVENAEKEIIITTPYFIPPRHALDTLLRGIERGVRIRVIIPERCDILLLDDVIRHSISEAQAIGVEVLVVRRAFVHAKLALVDSKRLVIGSANLDSRSLSYNRELMVSTTNRAVCHSSRLFIDRLQKIATRPTQEQTRATLPKFIIRSLRALM